MENCIFCKIAKDKFSNIERPRAVFPVDTYKIYILHLLQCAVSEYQDSCSFTFNRISSLSASLSSPGCHVIPT